MRCSRAGSSAAASGAAHAATPAAAAGASAQAVLTRGFGRLNAGLIVTLSLSAVLGWDWARLIVTRDGSKTRPRLRTDHARRTARLRRRDEPLKD